MVRPGGGGLAILAKAATVAVVGCSRDPAKDSHKVPKYLKAQGYRIVPVNPSAKHILGEKAYTRLSDIPFRVDVVDVFRPSREAKAVVDEAVALKPKLIWLQKGIRSAAGRRAAARAGIPYVEDRCIMGEHRRWAR
jgi:uncharacterized protein